MVAVMHVRMTYPTRLPATTFAHLMQTTVLDRKIVSLGIYPAVDPLASTKNPRGSEVNR